MKIKTNLIGGARIALANSGPLGGTFEGAEHEAERLDREKTMKTGLIGLANEYAVGADGWVRIAPYGDSIKERETRQADGTIKGERFLQRLTKPAAEAMAAKANSIWGKIKRFRVGVPIYARHPDLAQVSPATVALGNQGDTVERGVFAEIAAREDGLYGRPVMTRAGQEAIENEGLKFLSPFWWVRPIAIENGVHLVEPTELISVGLTDRPNIPGGQALANQRSEVRDQMSEQKQQQEPSETMKKKIAELLALFGVSLANEADEAAVEQGVQTALDAAKAKAQEVTALDNERTTLSGQVVTLTAKVGDLEGQLKAKTDSESAELAAAKVALENEKTARVAAEEKAKAERQARIESVLDQAVQAGRITAAERPQWAVALANEGDFAAKSQELASKAPTVKTVALTANLGQRKKETALDNSLASQIVALANERLKDFSGDWDQAYASVRKSHPALFENSKAAE